MKSEEQYTRCVVLILVFSFIPAIVSASEGPGETRKTAARLMVKDFSRLRIHKLYVPDFCGGSSHPNPQGAFFAAEFSKLLTETAKSFVVQSRVEAHRFLAQSSLTDCDLSHPEVLLKFSSNFGVDCLLSADRSADKNSYTMDFVLRDLSGKELSQFHYSEPAYPETEGLFPQQRHLRGGRIILLSLTVSAKSEASICPIPEASQGGQVSKTSSFLLS